MPQPRNDQAVTLLLQDYQMRYEPNFAWENAVAAHLMLPGLRGFWPMSVVGTGGDAPDLSGQDRTLTYTGNPVYGNRDLAPYIDLDGAGDCLLRRTESGLDITGSGAYILLANRGVTFGCWVNMDAVGGASDQYVIGKAVSGLAAGVQYTIRNPLGTTLFRVAFSSGAALEERDSGTIAAATWYHVVGRFSPTGSGAERSIFLDGVESSAATALASLGTTGADFRIGARDTGAGAGAVTEPMAGLVSLSFLCCQALPDTTIKSIWQQTRAMFNK